MIGTVITVEQFYIFQKAFKALAHKRALTAQDMLIYNILRGHDITRGFDALINPTKISNGLYPRHMIRSAVTLLVYKFAWKPENFSDVDDRYGNFFTANLTDSETTALKSAVLKPLKDLQQELTVDYNRYEHNRF